MLFFFLKNNEIFNLCVCVYTSVRTPACLHVHRVHAVSMEFRIGCHSLELEVMSRCVGVRRFTCALCKKMLLTLELSL